MASPTGLHEIRWLALDRSVRRRVARSVRQGTAVSASEDAAVAAGYCSALLDWLSQPKRLRPFRLGVALLIVAELLAAQTVLISPILGAVLGFGFLRLRTPRLRRQATASLRANEELAAETGLTPVLVRLPGHAWLAPGHRRRRLVVALTVALAIAAWLLVQSAFLIRR
jgi:hypothetical protein